MIDQRPPCTDGFYNLQGKGLDLLLLTVAVWLSISPTARGGENETSSKGAGLTDEEILEAPAVSLYLSSVLSGYIYIYIPVPLVYTRVKKKCRPRCQT